MLSGCLLFLTQYRFSSTMAVATTTTTTSETILIECNIQFSCQLMKHFYRFHFVRWNAFSFADMLCTATLSLSLSLSYSLCLFRRSTYHIRSLFRLMATAVAVAPASSTHDESVADPCLKKVTKRVKRLRLRERMNEFKCLLALPRNPISQFDFLTMRFLHFCQGR